MQRRSSSTESSTNTYKGGIQRGNAENNENMLPVTSDDTVRGLNTHGGLEQSTTDGQQPPNGPRTEDTKTIHSRRKRVRSNDDDHDGYPSKRARRLAKMPGEVGSDDKPKGLIRYTEESKLEFWLEDFRHQNGTWVTAVYHNDLRAELIAEWSQKGTYDHPRVSGSAETDVTCFLPEQKSWGGERENRPKILFQLHKHAQAAAKPENDNKDVEAQNQANNDALDLSRPRVAAIWYHGDQIVLDGDNHPVKRYKEIPATCSSEIEGWLMVAIRRSNPNIATQDIRARMPHFRTFTADGEGDKKQWSLQAHTMRQTRFLMRSASLSWDKRGGSDKFAEYLESILPEDCIEQNSTETFHDLDEVEIQQMKAKNLGNFGYRTKKKDNQEEPVKGEKSEETCADKDKTHALERGKNDGNGKRKHLAMLDEDFDEDFDEASLGEPNPKKQKLLPRPIRPSRSRVGKAKGPRKQQNIIQERQDGAGHFHEENAHTTAPNVDAYDPHDGTYMPYILPPPMNPFSHADEQDFQAPHIPDEIPDIQSPYQDFNNPIASAQQVLEQEQLLDLGDDAAFIHNPQEPHPNNLDPALFATRFGAPGNDLELDLHQFLNEEFLNDFGGEASAASNDYTAIIDAALGLNPDTEGTWPETDPSHPIESNVGPQTPAVQNCLGGSDTTLGVSVGDDGSQTPLDLPTSTNDDGNNFTLDFPPDNEAEAALGLAFTAEEFDEIVREIFRN